MNKTNVFVSYFWACIRLLLFKWCFLFLMCHFCVLISKFTIFYWRRTKTSGLRPEQPPAILDSLGEHLGLRPGWPPTILDKISLKIQHACQGSYSGLRPFGGGRSPLGAVEAFDTSVCQTVGIRETKSVDKVDLHVWQTKEEPPPGVTLPNLELGSMSIILEVGLRWLKGNVAKVWQNRLRLRNEMEAFKIYVISLPCWGWLLGDETRLSLFTWLWH